VDERGKERGNSTEPVDVQDFTQTIIAFPMTGVLDRFQLLING